MLIIWSFLKSSALKTFSRPAIKKTASFWRFIFCLKSTQRPAVYETLRIPQADISDYKTPKESDLFVGNCITPPFRAAGVSPHLFPDHDLMITQTCIKARKFK